LARVPRLRRRRFRAQHSKSGAVRRTATKQRAEAWQHPVFPYHRGSGTARAADRDLDAAWKIAWLGDRLEALPATKGAFLEGGITRTQAEVIASIATDTDENEWLARAKTGTVRALKAAVREARAGAAVAEPGESASRTPDDEAELDAQDGPRRPRSFNVPAEMLGKIDAVLELAARVAGAAIPAGTLWEFIAAEYLSGAVARMPGSEDANAEARALQVGNSAQGLEPGEGAICEPSSHAAVSPGPAEDPLGRQEWLERESRRWCYLPLTRPSLELHGDWKLLRNRCAEDGPRSAWDLHRDLTAALAAERRVAWQLGRLLGTIRNRRLWRSMLFASFSHYVGERLGISVRAADRLIRIDREGWRYAPLRSAYEAGELSPLVAETLVRVLAHVKGDRETQQAWIDYAQQTSFARLCEIVRAAERLRAKQAPKDRAPLGVPTDVERAMEEAAGGQLPLLVTAETRSGKAGSPMFVGARYAVWMTDGEHEVLRRAIDAVRGVLAEGSGREIPVQACLDEMLDHFVGEYDGEQAQRMRRKYALFDRDGWQCKVPGCRAYGPLHLHHIVFRAHGGGDGPENLVTLCDFHHQALHDSWIRCVGQAPDTLYWELGVDRREGLSEAPVARIAGHRRLATDEYWDGVRVRVMTTGGVRVA